MPIYEYECTVCGRIEEVLQKFTDKPLTTCRHCNGKLTKLISHSAFHLKGSGWYVTDYAKSSNTSAQPSSAGAKPDGQAKPDSQTKPETASKKNEAANA